MNIPFFKQLRQAVRKEREIWLTLFVRVGWPSIIVEARELTLEG